MNAEPNPTSITLAREPAFRLGSLEVRPATREIVDAEGREVLEPRVMQVLVALARVDGAVVTRDELMMLCWEGRVVGEDALNRIIPKLRRLSARRDAGFALETIRKVGYRLVRQEEAASDTVPSSPASEHDEAATTPPPAAFVAAERSRLRHWPWVAATLSIVALTVWVAFAAVQPAHPGLTLATTAREAPALWMIPGEEMAADLPEPDSLELQVEGRRGRPLTGAAAPGADRESRPVLGAMNEPMSLLPPE
ncbi:MAG: winged helix-turn-helix domain-containing protein [Alphaproteobacteria bacterium]|nr:winged helix-turn-helix domain-containing protein [Alphaproteobacteria bacterium]